MVRRYNSVRTIYSGPIKGICREEDFENFLTNELKALLERRSIDFYFLVEGIRIMGAHKYQKIYEFQNAGFGVSHFFDEEGDNTIIDLYGSTSRPICVDVYLTIKSRIELEKRLN